MSNIKNSTNRFKVTKAQENKFSHHIAELPETKSYRKELEPLIGAVVNIKCEKTRFIHSIVDDKKCFRVLLLNAEITKIPKSRGIDVPFTVKHIWTILDKDWIERNNYSKQCIIKLRGFIYLYNHHGKKNIGFQTLSARVIEKKGDTDEN